MNQVVFFPFPMHPVRIANMDTLKLFLSQLSPTELSGILSGLIFVGLFILVLILLKRKLTGLTLQLKDSFSLLETRLDHSDRGIKDEISRNREETALNALREERNSDSPCETPLTRF